jgi:Sulfocyanin (SoxE) domain
MKNHRWQMLAVLLAVFRAETTFAEDSPPPGHDLAAHAPAGLRKDLIAGLTEADFLRLGDKPRTVKVTLAAAVTPENYGMNFNGYAKGRAVYTIPKGWTVEVTFINPSPVPHSLVVVDRDMVKKLQVGDPAFAGASVPNPTQGLSMKKAAFSFVASEAGEYAFACGFPSHALNGHWVALNVREDAKTASLKLGDGDAKDAQ